MRVFILGYVVNITCAERSPESKEDQNFCLQNNGLVLSWKPVCQYCFCVLSYVNWFCLRIWNVFTEPNCFQLLQV